MHDMKSLKTTIVTTIRRFKTGRSSLQLFATPHRPVEFATLRYPLTDRLSLELFATPSHALLLSPPTPHARLFQMLLPLARVAPAQVKSLLGLPTELVFLGF
jgi:hypothetical protein